ncbi:iron chelate uptake ABC transporter family permease subunit [Pseudogemmobacter sonorensis]|uniref:iron chelate uptake ABC transporter family permease subunit n=1 Tax=Pseudogemmobacter sonorensis TaxID=2989681 RepID=UPI0036BE686A
MAFLGAILAALLVHALAGNGRRGNAPLRLVLAGVIVSDFLALTTAVLLILDEAMLDAVRQWTVGSLVGQGRAGLAAALPWLGAALGLALLLRARLSLLALGPEVAAGLGLAVARWCGRSGSGWLCCWPPWRLRWPTPWASSA